MITFTTSKYYTFLSIKLSRRMKNRLLILVSMILLTSWAYAQQTVLVSNKTLTTAAASWKSAAHNFGKIKQGEPVTATFTFTNTGDAPLVLTEVKGSCGCTATDYTKEALAPGKSGYVKATYNAASPGVFSKTVTVTNSTGEVKLLIIKGEVIANN
jgi:hypothetical protein